MAYRHKESPSQLRPQFRIFSAKVIPLGVLKLHSVMQHVHFYACLVVIVSVASYVNTFEIYFIHFTLQSILLIDFYAQRTVRLIYI